MNQEQWNQLSKAEQDVLASKYGLSRGGAHNELLAGQLEKLPQTEKKEEQLGKALEEKPKKRMGRPPKAK